MRTSRVCRATLEFDYRFGWSWVWDWIGLELGWDWVGVKIWVLKKNLGPKKIQAVGWVGGRVG